jgi:hypothetical protein
MDIKTAKDEFNKAQALIDSENSAFKSREFLIARHQQRCLAALLDQFEPDDEPAPAPAPAPAQ